MSKLKKLVLKFLKLSPEVRFEDVVYLLEAFGFEEKRSKGSHHTFSDSQGRTITVPRARWAKSKEGVFTTIN